MACGYKVAAVCSGNDLLSSPKAAGTASARLPECVGDSRRKSDKKDGEGCERGGVGGGFQREEHLRVGLYWEFPRRHLHRRIRAAVRGEAESL